jgi:hypothetical protein
VAVGDVDGDGKLEIVAAAGPGGLPLVQVIKVTSSGGVFSLAYGPRFQAFGTGFTGGVFVSAGRLDASGQSRIVVGAGGQDDRPNDAPVMRLFDGSGQLLRDYALAFESSFHGGVTVAVSGVSGQSGAILAGPAELHAARVNALDAAFQMLPLSFDIRGPSGGPDPLFGNGLFVAATADMPRPVAR